MKTFTLSVFAARDLRRRKKQYIALALGIVFSMIFSSGVLFFLSSVDASLEENRFRTYGKQDALLIGTTEDALSRLRSDPKIRAAGAAHIIEKVYTDDPAKGSAVGWLDETALQLAYPILTEGRMPSAPGEVAAERDALLRMSVDAAVGERFTVAAQTANGKGYLDPSYESTYTLVGVLAGKRGALEKYALNRNVVIADGEAPAEVFDLPALFVCTGTQTAPGGREILTAYIKATDEKNADGLETYLSQTYADAGEIAATPRSAAGFSAMRISSLGETGQYLSLILLAASAAGVFGAMDANLADRKKQIGLLRAVGATRAQIAGIFARETALIALISLPVSLALSYFLTKLLIGLLGDEFVFLPDLKTLLVSGGFGLACIAAASAVPLVRASRVAPMFAIRGAEMNRKMRKKRIRSKSFFSVPSLLAKRRLTFARRRQVSVALMLAFLTGLAALAVPTFLDSYRSSARLRHDFDITSDFGWSGEEMYNTAFSGYGYFTESDRASLAANREIAAVSGVKKCSVNLLMDEYGDYFDTLSLRSTIRYKSPPFPEKSMTKRQIAERAISEVAPEYEAFREKLGYDRELFSASLCACEPAALESEYGGAVLEGRIDMKKLLSGEEILIAAPLAVGYDVAWSGNGLGETILPLDGGESALKNRSFTKTGTLPIHAGDRITLSAAVSGLSFDDWQKQNAAAAESGKIFLPDDLRRIDREVTVGAIVSPDTRRFEADFSLLTTTAAFPLFGVDRNYVTLNIDLAGECDAARNDEMTEYLAAFAAGKQVEIYSDFEYAQHAKQRLRATLVTLSGIMTLLLAAGIGVMLNTLSAQLREDKRTIGTLRAVGADARTVGSVYFRQILAVFALGGGGGIAASALLFFGWRLYTDLNPIETNAIRGAVSFSPVPATALCLALLAVCCAVIGGKKRRQTKRSVTDNIREL